uniref:Uncharacterized protein n=1 Tax=Moniliophthora roreri TaxID=221103 RepID=A0A0W0F820_MONRR
MSAYIDWYTKAHADYIRYLKEDGKYQTTLNCVLRPFMKLATMTRDNHDIHVFGFALDTTHDTQGKTLSCMWGTPEMLEIQNQYALNIKEKITNLEAMLRVSQMNQCGIDVSYHYTALIPRLEAPYIEKGARDRHRAIWTAIMKAETQLVCKEAVAVGSFVKRAGALQICLLNWPDNVPFPGLGGVGPRGLRKDHYKQFLPAKEEWIRKLVDGSLLKKEQQEPTVVCFECWTAGGFFSVVVIFQWIPIVQSSNGSDLGCACDSEDWLKKHSRWDGKSKKVNEQAGKEHAGKEQAQEKGKAHAVEQAEKEGGEEESQSPIPLKAYTSKGPSKHTLPAAPPSSSPHKAPRVDLFKLLKHSQSRPWPKPIPLPAVIPSRMQVDNVKV